MIDVLPPGFILILGGMLLPLLRGLAESFLVKVKEQEAETVLANVKAKMEA